MADNDTLAWDLVNDFATMPREDPDDANRAAWHLVSKLKSLGIPVEVHEPSLYLSLPLHAEIRVGSAVLPAKVPAFSRDVPDGITAPLTYLPAGHSALPSAVAGRIIVTEGFALPNTVAALDAAGAAGVITVNPGERIHWGTVSTVWGTPGLEDQPRLPRIASAAVNRSDGDRLIAAANRSEPATLVASVRQGWFPSVLPVVRIPGAIEPERFVLLHGHYDSWQVGVGDNGTGNACMLELAHRLWQRRASLRRSVWLAWWPGHSTGRYGGSAWFADTYAAEIDAGCVVQMNCDSPGCRWATSYERITMMPETAAAVQDVVQAVTGQHAHAKRAARNSDWSFNNIGVSGAFMASSMIPENEMAAHGYSYRVGGCGGNIAWHTEDDTLEIADREVLARDIELYTAAVLRFADAPVLPLDWRAALADHRATLGRYQTACGDRFDLSPACAALDALGLKLDRVHTEAGHLGEARMNALLLALARVLVPINHVLGPRFTHDPALDIPPLPALAACTALHSLPAEQTGFALATLLRGRNRVAAAYREAARLVDAA